MRTHIRRKASREGASSRLMFCLSLGAVLLAAGGCITQTPPKTAELPPPEVPKLVLQSGDEVEILYHLWPDLNTKQAVRLDGMISLQLVGEIEAAGKAPEELRQELLKLYEAHLKDPEITVIANTLGNQRIFVGGEVRLPGVIIMSGRMTVLEAIMQAGGFDKTSAKMNSVVVIRHRDGKQYARSINLNKALQKPESDPLYLAPCDVVFVPRTAIDRLDQWVEKYVNQIVPRNFYANYVWNDQRDAITGQETNSFNIQVPGL